MIRANEVYLVIHLLRLVVEFTRFLHSAARLHLVFVGIASVRNPLLSVCEVVLSVSVRLLKLGYGNLLNRPGSLLHVEVFNSAVTAHPLNLSSEPCFEVPKNVVSSF